MDSEDGDVLAAGRFSTQCNPGKGRPTNRPTSMAPKSRNVEMSCFRSRRRGSKSATISCYYIPPGLIASGYVLSLGAGSHPGCLASEEIPFEPLPG